MLGSSTRKDRKKTKFDDRRWEEHVKYLEALSDPSVVTQFQTVKGALFETKTRDCVTRDDVYRNPFQIYAERIDESALLHSLDSHWFTVLPSIRAKPRLYEGLVVEESNGVATTPTVVHRVSRSEMEQLWKRWMYQRFRPLLVQHLLPHLASIQTLVDLVFYDYLIDKPSGFIPTELERYSMHLQPPSPFNLADAKKRPKHLPFCWAPV